MKTYLTKLILLFIILLHVSCSEQTNKLNTVKSNVISSYKLDIYDTLKINNYQGKWFITDAVSNYLLGFDLNTNDLILINIITNSIKMMNMLGGGPEEYGRIKAVSFLNDSTIVVLDDKRVNFYNFSGLFEASYNINDKVGMVGWNFLFNIPCYYHRQDTCILLRHYNYNYVSNNFDLVKWITQVNLSKKLVQEFVPFQKYNFLINNKSEVFPDIVPFYDVSDSNIFIKYPYENFLEVYSVLDLGFKKRINLLPDFFNRFPRKRKQEDSQKLFVNEQINSSFINLIVMPKVVINEYKTGIPKSKIVKTRAELIQNDIDFRYRDYYAICTFNDDSISDDIALQWHGNKFTTITANSINQIFFHKLSSSNVEDSTFTLYIGRFIKKD